MDEGPRLLLRPGDSVGRDEVVSKVGSGGMASVYVVRRAAAGGFERHLALKIMHPHLCDDPEFVELFVHEARVVSSIHHRNVVQIYDVGTHDGVPFMLMELLRGSSLGRIMKRARGGDIDVSTGFWLEVLAQTAEGLDAAHRATGPDGAPLGIVHRDVVPSNVFVCTDGLVKVLDFGIAVACDRTSRTRTGQVRGTLPYVAPERISLAGPVDARVDIWSLGVMAWECLAGRPLFRSEDDAETLWNVVYMEVPPLGSLRPDLPATVGTAVMACLDRATRARPSSAADLAEVFAEAARAAGVNGPSGVAAELKGVLETDDLDTATTARALALPDRARSPVPGRPDPSDGLDLRSVEGAATRTIEESVEPRRPGRHLRWLGIGLGGLVATALLLVAGFLLGGNVEREEEGRSAPSPAPAPAAREERAGRDEADAHEDLGPASPADRGEPDVAPERSVEEGDGSADRERPPRRAAKRPRRAKTAAPGATPPGATPSRGPDERLIRELSPE